MPRPRCCRRVEGQPGAVVFKPAGIPARELDEVVMSLDEFEAIRLADLEGLYQDEAATRMGVSRPTFGRLIAAARRKVAETLVSGKVLRIEGGPVLPQAVRCPRCAAELPGGQRCPHCDGDRARPCCRRRRGRASAEEEGPDEHLHSGG